MDFPSHLWYVRLLATVGILAMLLLAPLLGLTRYKTPQQLDNLFRATTGPRPSRWRWTLFALGVTAAGVFLYLMQVDQLQGGQEVWPLYAFLGATLLFEALWFPLMQWLMR